MSWEANKHHKTEHKSTHIHNNVTFLQIGQSVYELLDSFYDNWVIIIAD